MVTKPRILKKNKNENYKNYKYFNCYTLFFQVVKRIVISLILVESVDSPTNISADFFITQDNSGLVKITPNGEGVTQFEVYFEADNE